MDCARSLDVARSSVTPTIDDQLDIGRIRKNFSAEHPLAIRAGALTRGYRLAVLDTTEMDYMAMNSPTWRARYIDAINAAAFKSSSQFEKKLGAVAAWIRQGERVAATRDCQPFDKKSFKKSLQTLRALTNETDPDLFVPQLIQTCAEFGVAVVFEPAPKGCPAWGATKWLAPDKALLMLSLRYKTNDHLWFAFFHEAAHIFLHSKKMLFVELKGPIHVEN